ncbi:DUF2931 family protein [Dyella sp. 20L07]|uniref:DUF2931 family protein n=1 Tax=Dyella sp. 20L07 TaxID=3384240 RepID=UPI003D2DC0B9
MTRAWPFLVLLGLLVLLPACASEPRGGIQSSLCGPWAVRVFAPGYMEAWVEALDVKDDRGDVYDLREGMAGELGQVAGWGYVGGGGGTPHPSTAGAPVEMYLRWQSLAEPQTYTWHFAVSEELRRSLVKKELGTWMGKPEVGCRDSIAISVAPGGRVVVWNAGLGFEPVEVMRGQADVEPLGPGQGWGKGYAYPLSDKAQQYVNEHGIPYGSWDD